MSGPFVLAHRGASGYRPELTEAALWLAVEQGADGIEIDVLPTRDGRLAVRHDRALEATTDIARKRVLRHRLEDLDWADVTRLRARERWPALRPRSARYDGREPVLDLPAAVRIAEEADVVLVVEVKDATALAAIDRDPLPLLLRDLEGSSARIVLESFEKAALAALAPLGHPLVYLLDARGSAPDELARGGPSYAQELRDPTTLRAFMGVSLALDLVARDRVHDLHDAGLEVWAWTLRAENAFLPLARRIGDDPAALGDWRGAWSSVLDAGVDAVFADQPDLAIALRTERASSLADRPAEHSSPSR